ncbi:HD-GYP domain-containing protein [Simiduia curdlanivorans]|uniref:HD-GYP domain-containing protein n=1 Tax=Simiduia curdlanivorans TaxID=1492769 RepID=A0ABV8V9Q4_9GAMM|nr:HD-GYP domain-containing protein [Simiduia curdlanivorans]MDN3639506.1 HD-GYP domain-containing protein [Simiduia curdlanivorans]
MPTQHQPLKNSTKLTIDELRLGMFVSELDCDWLVTPFLLQGFEIEKLEQIEILRAHCKHVWVTTKTIPASPANPLLTLSEAAPKKASTPTQAISISAEQEHRQARGIYTASKLATHTILTSAASGPPLKIPDADATVHHCVQSILRNPDALLWMSKIRNKDEYTAEHCLNVCILAIAFGRHLGLAEQELYKVGTAGLLHDVGKMRVAPSVLNKPSQLTPKEFKAMSAHVVHGRNLLQQTPDIAKEVIDAAHSHHERIDGTGYPRKLKGEDISYLSKIISIVDTYDAITSHRCYATARPTTEALKILYEQRGKQFDTELTLAFIKFIGLYPPGTIVELVNGRLGLVLATNEQTKHLPKIICVTDSQKEACKHEFIDLSLISRGELTEDHLIKQLHVDGSFGIHLHAFKAKGLSFAIG